MAVCKWKGCDRQSRSNGFCAGHYMRDRMFRQKYGLSSAESVPKSMTLYAKRMDEPMIERRTRGTKQRISASWTDGKGRQVASVGSATALGAAMRIAETLRPFGKRERRQIVRAVLAELS